MGCLTLEVKLYIPSLSLIMLSFLVLEERDTRGRFICVQCPSGALKGLGENLDVVSENNVCIHCCLC